MFNQTPIPWDPQLWHLAEVQLSMTVSWSTAKPYTATNPKKSRLHAFVGQDVDKDMHDQLNLYTQIEIEEWYRYAVNEYRKVYEPDKVTQ